MRTSVLALAAAVAVVLAGASTRADVIINDDFDANTTAPTYNYGYLGDTVTSAGVVAGAGTSGSNAFVLAFTPTTGGAHGVGIGFNGVNLPSAAPTSLGDITYSLDVKEANPTGDVPMNLQFKYLAPDGTLGGPTDGNLDALLEVHIPFTYDGATGGFQHFSGSLSGATPVTGDLATVQANFGSLSLVQLNIAGDWYNTTPLGSGSASVTADNVMVQQAVSAIPEPASLGLLGLGALALIRRRR